MIIEHKKLCNTPVFILKELILKLKKQELSLI